MYTIERRRLSLVAGLWILSAWWSLAPAQLSFTDVTAPAGLEFVQHHPVAPPDCLFDSGRDCQPERKSGGAAAGDVDSDGWVDLYVTRLDVPDILFRNLGDGSFEDVSAAAGLSRFNLQSNGAAFGDIDNDGDLDLFVTTMGEASDPVNRRFYLFINDGTGRFREEALLRGAAHHHRLANLAHIIRNTPPSL